MEAQPTLQLARNYKMHKVTYITDIDGVEQAIIDRGNDEFTSMPKSEYDRQQAEQSTPNLAE
jgi:hypothetical protein